MGKSLMLVLVPEEASRPALVAAGLLAPYDFSFDEPRRWRDFLTRSEVRDEARAYKVSPGDLQALARRMQEEDPNCEAGVGPRGRFFVWSRQNRKGWFDWWKFVRWDPRRGDWLDAPNRPRRMHCAHELADIWNFALEDLPSFVVTPSGRLHRGELWPDRESRAVRQWRQRLRRLLVLHRKCFAFGVVAHM